MGPTNHKYFTTQPSPTKKVGALCKRHLGETYVKQ